MLKADDKSSPAFALAGSRQWTYVGAKHKKMDMPYWSVPGKAVDDPEVFTKWAEKPMKRR